MKRLKQFIAYIWLLGDKLEEINDRLRKMEKEYIETKCKLDLLNINRDTLKLGTIEISGKWSFQTDYFTKERINDEATNTNTLHVVKDWYIVKHLFKEWNQTKDVKKINNKFYLFIEN